MGERRDGQVFWIELLIRILAKFILYFYDLYANFYEFLNLESVSRIFNK
jgi:hypothetical protein